MAKLGVLKPLRGTESSLANVVLENGEIAFAYPESGPGTGLGGIKMGNGTDTFGNLDWYVNGSNGIGNDVITDASESTNTAAYVHEVGNYFMNKNEKLCKTTKKINIGDTISVGTGENDNCVLVSVGEELSLLNSNIGGFIIEKVSKDWGTTPAQDFAGDDIDATKQGYKVVGVAGIQAPDWRLVLNDCYVKSDTTVRLRFYNPTNESSSGTASIWCIYVPVI